MYHASKLFKNKDVLDIYTQQKQNNECVLSTTGLESKAAYVSDQTEGCEVYGASTMYFAVYDCRQLEYVSSLENVHMVTQILSQVFIWYVLLPPSSIIK